jgi:dinuclear metal center YbgI/SA1388 family protein
MIVKRNVARRDELVSFLDQYLEIKTIQDDAWNGLQVEGTDLVGKAFFAVDAGMETLQQAKKHNANMIVVHHGMFWQGSKPCLVGPQRRQCEFLLKEGISLYAAHLPLDKHPEVGNNAQLLKILGYDVERPFCKYHGQDISFIGKTSKPKSVEAIVKILQGQLGAECKVLPFGKKIIHRMAVCSGGGANYGILQEALDAEVDLYLTGDATEMYHKIKDNNFNVIFAGHHATEIVGVRALSNLIAKKFDVEALFFDIPTSL